MKVTSSSFAHGERIPAEFAFCDFGDPVDMAPNVNPHIAWDDAPSQTRSFVLICHDPDVPSSGEDVNQEGREVPEDLPRVDFTHWVLVDIPADTTEIAAGAHSDEVTPRGKDGPDGPEGMRHGLNDYTGWFEGDDDMEGEYFGYDGPCPPWNDSIVHHYHFTVYALDVPEVDVSGSFTRDDVLEAIDGHILDEASIMGTYHLNERLK